MVCCGCRYEMKRRDTEDAVDKFRKMSVSMNLRQAQAMPMSIRAAKDVLRGEHLSEAMICNILRNIIVKKLCEGGMEKRVKKSVVNSGGKSKKKKKVE
ncbi:hypothetical protein TeGR_g13400 [Tetraparma gracilis]|uniref:Uncharacterized protein n=1 Tax=Tetraparma gracilis TaxID=2962635 RepID=A0ABQ6MG05_9STRA|nr:hypothetical protein TeGR_g13400 [Tetraparma gracilis]